MHTASIGLPERYRIIRPLGHGGQGTVFLVRDAVLDGILLSLKTVSGWPAPPGLPGGEGMGAPDREFLLKCRLAHPALARVRDFGILSGGRGIYFTSDFAPGTDLLQWGLDHPFPRDWPALYSVAAQVLGALHAIHGAGFIHGDVKPTNLIIRGSEGGEGPKVILIDLGSACAIGAAAGPCTGTPAYLGAPEIAGSPEVDLHCLGMSLFHAAVGRLPFAIGSDEELTAWRRGGHPANLGQWLEDVPPTAQALVEGLTAPRGSGGFRTAREALEALERKASKRFRIPFRPEPPTRLFGRDRELEKVLRGLCAPEGPLILIASAPGLGKSRLLEDSVRRAQATGLRTVECRASQSAQGLREVLRLLPAGGADLLLERETPEHLGARLLDLAQGEPILVALDGVLDPPRTDGSGPGETNAPKEDPAAQRAWRAFLRGFLQREPGRLRILLATGRPDLLRRELGESSRPILSVELGPLDREAIRAMALEFFRAASIPDRIVDDLLGAASGVPGRLRESLLELVRCGARVDPLGMIVAPDGALGTPGPGTASALVRDPIQRRILAVLSLHPGTASAALLARLCVQPAHPGPSTTAESVLEPDLEELRWEGLLERSGDEVPCYHLSGRARESAWSGGMNAQEVGEIRAGILEDLRARTRCPGLPGPDLLIALSRSALLAGEGPLAARAAGQAIHRLRRDLRLGDALALLDEILPLIGPWILPPRAARLLAARGARISLLDGRRGSIEKARARLEKASQDGLSTDSAPSLLLRALLEQRLGRQDLAVRDIEAALHRLDETRGGSPPPPASFEAGARLAALRYAMGRPEGTAELLAQGIDLEEHLRRILGGESGSSPGQSDALRQDLPSCARALLLFGALTARHGSREDAQRILETCLLTARRTGRREIIQGALHEMAPLRAAQGRFAQAREALEECRAIARQIGDHPGLLRAQVNLATVCQKEGDLEGAERLFLEARGIADGLGDEGAAAAAWMGLEIVRRDRGDLLGGLRIGARILRRFPRSQKTIHAVVHNNIGEIHLALGRPEGARRERARALQIARACDYRLLTAHALLGLGIVRWAVGDLRGAESRLHQVLAPASTTAGVLQGTEDHYLRAVAWQNLGLVRAARQDGRGALQALGRAMCHAQRASNRPQVESALLCLLETLLAMGRRDRARMILERSGSLIAGPTASASGRHRFQADAIHLRTDVRWQARMPMLEAIVERALAAGELHVALQILREAARDPVFSSQPPPVLIARSEALAFRFLRRSPERDRRSYRAVHGIGATADPCAPPASAGTGSMVDPLSAIAGRWAARKSTEAPDEDRGPETQDEGRPAAGPESAAGGGHGAGDAPRGDPREEPLGSQ